MNRISIKLGVYFLIFVLVLEAGLFIYLYHELANSRITEELESLRLRGNSHRDVLEKNFDSTTLHHVALMESEAKTEVVIVDEGGKILSHSNPIKEEIRQLMKEHDRKQGPYRGKIIQGDWSHRKYIATASPIHIDGKEAGTVYMFQHTDSIRSMIARLKHHFYVVSGISVLFSVITIFLLSKIITSPLVRMKRATEKLSEGNFAVKLNVRSQDELGQLGNAIESLAKELQYLKRERNEFLANVSHELRTPLTYIKGYTDIAGRPNLAVSDREKYLGIIQEETERLSALVQNLFELAQLDQNAFLIKKELVYIHVFLESIFQQMKPMFDRQHIQLDFSCPEGLMVKVDTGRFKQVIMNLLDNALSYSEPYTTVRLEVKKDDGDIWIKVTDEGIGIPPKDLPFIFDRLYRVEKSRSRKSGGTGLGLAIVKEIVEAHGGMIQAESMPGKGTTFTIVLKEENEHA
ncbi:sensor histidine kinase [Priestia abyssalis]|uniref:sensor histidine kinase n=1 Tax=Priestia abyssalis TaxID=1221450 RepID=UPI000994A308|nr:ATP-binding protein [Priestia abyssalis]